MASRRILYAALSGVGILAVLIAFGPQPIRTGEPTGDPTVSQALREHLRGGEGAVAGFVYDDGDVRFGGLGADENTEFEIGSITKTFNAELLRQQIEAGTITLDTTVGELIDVPGAPIADVRMEELVNHTSGLPRIPAALLSDRFITLFTQGTPYREASPQDILDYAADATLKDRGQKSYSNYGHALLGQLLARNAHMPYEELLRMSILEPAGMESTYLALPGTTDSAPKGLGTGGRPVGAWEMNGWAPAGAIRSTATDMAAYVAWIDRHGRPDFGWHDIESAGIQYPYHNGGTGGFSTMLVWDPANEHRAAYVANASAAGVEDLGIGLLRTGGEH